MSQEKLQMCTSGVGIRAARKVKQNKAPQRGLGVEKLEKIRLEEQRKNGGVGTGGGGTGQVVVMPLPPPPPPPRYDPPPPIPFPPASLSDFTSVVSMGSSSLVNMSNSGSLYASRATSSSSVGGHLRSFGWPLGSAEGGSLSSTMLNSDSTLKLESELGNGSTLKHLQNDPKHNWPPLGGLQWRQQNQNQFAPLVIPPLSSSSSSSGLNFQLEPPSNQNTYHSYMHPFAHDDHKMAGMKRTWPFGLDNLSDSFSGNVASFASPFARADDSYGKRNPALREGPSNPAPNHLNWRGKWELNPTKRSKEITTLDGEFLNPNKRRKENGNLDGNFLSLGLSTNPVYSSSTPKYNQPTFPFPPPDYHELSKIELPFQRNIEDQVIHQQQHSLLIPSKEQITKHATSTSSKVEPEDGLDLTLKL